MARFVRNPGFERKLQGEALYRQGLKDAAEPAAEAARGIAHRIMPRGRGEQIRVEASGGEVRIVNRNYGAHLDEYGSANNPPYSPLRRGVREAGLRFREVE